MDSKELYSRAGIRKILGERSLSANKRLGQNFLLDKNKIIQIVDSIDIVDKCVLEIGPGLGSMTAEIASRAKKVVAVEIDNGFLSVLSDVLCVEGEAPTIVEAENLKHFEQSSWQKNNVTIIHGDILKISAEDIAATLDSEEFVVCANLPYYITTPIIMNLIEAEQKTPEMVFMMQKELGDRIAAKPGTKSYGSLTLAMQYYVDIEKVTTVSPSCFYPQPNVDSIVLLFRTKENPPVIVKNEKRMFSLIRSAFAMRRKTLYNNLAHKYSSIDKESLKQVIKDAGIAEMERAENLSLEQFALLSDGVDNFLE